MTSLGLVFSFIGMRKEEDGKDFYLTGMLWIVGESTDVKRLDRYMHIVGAA